MIVAGAVAALCIGAVPVEVRGIADPPALTDTYAPLLRIDAPKGYIIRGLALPAPGKKGDPDHLVALQQRRVRARLILGPDTGRYEFDTFSGLLTGFHPIVIAAPVDTAWARLALRRKLSRTLEIRMTTPPGRPVEVDLLARKRPRGFDPDARARRAWPGPSRIDTGVYRVLEDVVIPVGATVKIKENAVIELAPGRSIFVFGQLFMDPGATIRPAGIGPWGVVALIGPGTAGSRIDGARLVRGSMAFAGTRDLNGALSIVDTQDVVVTDTIIEDARGEDGIWVSGSDVTLSDLHVVRPASDGVDLVGSRATLDVSVIGSGDDGVDVGKGSTATVRAVVHNAGGKGLSVGQGSTATIEGGSFVDTARAIAVFDGSTVTGRHVAIVRTRRAAVQLRGDDARLTLSTVSTWKTKWKHADDPRIRLTDVREVPYDPPPPKLRSAAADPEGERRLLWTSTAAATPAITTSSAPTTTTERTEPGPQATRADLPAWILVLFGALMGALATVALRRRS